MSNKNKLNYFQYLIRYTLSHLQAMMIISSFSLMFLFIFWLYGIELASFKYALLLYFTFGLVMLAFFSFRSYQKYQKLIHIRETLIYQQPEFHTPKNEIEILYQEIIAKTNEMHHSQITELEKLQDEQIDYFTMWAHQIKTPISALHLLLSDLEDEKNDQLSSEVFRIEQYVEMVLYYLRANADSTDYQFKYYVVNDLVQPVLRKYAHFFIRKKIKLNFEPSEAQILTDKKWFAFALEQIISNAVKYTTTGSITIVFDIKTNTLSISDTGSGITEDDLPRIFEKGYTGFNGRMKEQSTGIGLYMAKLILNNLSHQLQISSTLGVGTTVSIDTNRLDLLSE